jgi:mono/diheme cytochrome c family protein
MARHRVFLAPLLLAVGVSLLAGYAGAQGQSKPTPAEVPAAASAIRQPSDEDLRIEGEKRFHTNCGRCHQSPHKFPPRMMATIVRHMRVRATITDEDMRLILRYMTQ